jgi:carboxypeptidase T
MELIVEVKSDSTQRSLARLLEMPLGLDVWETKADRIVLRAEEAAVDRIAKMGYQVRQIIQAETHVAMFAEASALSAFHSAASLADDMRNLAESHPEIAELKEIGRSVEGRPILALRIGVRHGSARKILFMGCHHAREWVAVEVPFLLAKELIEKRNDAPISGWLTQAEIWVVPMVNPDGHEFTRTSARLWRKNRRRNADGSFGVDPNRNYGYMWGTLDVPTSSHTPSDETYVGPRAFSEPETRAVRDLVAVEQFAGVVTYHSFSQLILYPWGYTADPIADPVDRARMTQLAAEMAAAIHHVHAKTYIPQPSAQLYPTAGDTTDWTYGTYGIPSFTIELRPATVEQGGFILPASEIQPTYEENRPAAFHLIDELLAPALAVAAE